jgi:hypothetical protein
MLESFTAIKQLTTPAPPLTPDSWNIMMDITDSSWSGTSRWGSIGADISTFSKG